MFLPLAVMVVFIFFLTTTFYGLSGYQEDLSAIVEDYYNTHRLWVIFLFIIFVIFIFVFGILQYSFTPVYLILYQEKGTNFTTRDILERIFHKYLGKIVLFIFVSLLVAIPVGIIALLSALLLIITLVGIFLPLAAVSLWFSMWFIDYLSGDKGIWRA
jgi:hypothetical protein